ncbi:virulence factor MviN [Bifidobacterium sp. LC6]|uniref:Virulence factor MviN n=2 Tax=Bifidobacterium colobi TaxID=2809026 RepID=A0ABS5UUG4_9BIFI|nr:virulence factor MviN [Bifidobacterium colobi]
MKPQLGDTILNRYTLVSALREEPGLEAWKANDRILAKDCELFLVTDKRQLDIIDDIAGTITATHPEHFMPVQKFRRQGDSMLVITPVDNGKSLTEYLSNHSHVLGADAIRSIIGELSEAIQPMLNDKATAGIVLNTDTVRITSSGIEITGAPFAPLLADTSGAALAQDGPERHAVRQLAALLYAMLTKQRNPLEPNFSLAALPQNAPGEFQVICKRGLELFEQGDRSLPMASLAELNALLGEWKPLTELDDTQIELPPVAGDCSILRVLLNPPADDEHIAEIPESLIARKEMPELAISQSGPMAAAETGDGADSATDAQGRHLFDFKFSNAWNAENLSGDDTADWFNTFNGGVASPAAPLPDGASDGAGETTSRIPIYDAGGREIQPGEESLRALEEEQARIAEVAAIPPSYNPKNPPVKSSTEDDHLPNENLFGSFTTKVVALIVALVVVVAAGFWAWSAFQKSGVDPADATDTSKSENGDWPDVDMNAVPFGDNKTSGSDSSDSTGSSDASKSGDSSSDASSDSSKSDSSSKSTEKKSTVKKVVKDKTSKSVPKPHVINTTAYTISSADFVTDPGGQSGYGYVMHLDQAHDVSRVVITIRSSGGKGYIRANTTGDPSQGTEMASFTFAEGGTTEVKLSKTVNTQDLMLWVPINSLPQNQLYIQKVEVF